MYYHLLVLGCQMNKSDSERVSAVLGEMGYEWTDDEDNADILGILACSVRQKAIDKVYARISSWNRMKSRRNLLTFVSGCMLPDDKLKFLRLFDLVFTMEELPDLPDMIRQYGIVTPAAQPDLAASPVRDDGINRFWQLRPNHRSDFEAFVPIQNGCDKFCTFCAVPYTRGREVSRPSAEILAEVGSLVEKGYKSITLLGQNVNSYGLDKKGNEVSFAALLDRIGRLGKESDRNFWVYFTSPHPRDMTEEVISVMARYDCLAKQVHLPLQSGDDKVLIRMNRNHNMDRYRRVVEHIRNTIPEATLFTDIIVGFAGESEEQLENTRKAIAEFRYNMAYIAMYSPRPGATSSRWTDDVPGEVKKARLHRLTEELRKHTSAYNNGLIGRTVRVLVTGPDRKEGFLTGHTEGRIIIRFPFEGTNLVGRFVDVRVGSASDFSAEGSLVGMKEHEMIGE